jgi:PAS domain S-box-containing protein
MAKKIETNKPKANDPLNDYKERYRSLFDLSLEAIFVCDLKGNFIEANNYALKSLGYERKDIPKISFTSLLDVSDLKNALNAIKTLLQNKVQKELLEFKLKRKDGTFVWFEINSSPLSKDGEIFAIQGIGRNITEKKLADEKIRESEERYRLLFTTMLSGFALHEIICDKDGKPVDYRFLEINPAFEEMTRLKAKNIIGKTVLEVLPQTEKYWIDVYGDVALTGKSARFEHFTQSLNKYFEVLAFSPKKNQFATMFIDITDKKTSQEKLSETQLEDKKMLDLMTGRELKMVELKNKINELQKKLDEKK